jgi:hypothetical protein
LPVAELRIMPKIRTKLKPTYTLTLTYSEAEALRQFCLRARGAWNGALDNKLDAALIGSSGGGPTS